MDLKTARKIRNLTQEELAKKVGISQAEISNAEAGKVLDVDRRRRIEAFFSPMPIDWKRNNDDAWNDEELKTVGTVVNFLILKKDLNSAAWLTSLLRKQDIYRAATLMIQDLKIKKTRQRI